jgi:phage-related protein
VANPGGAPEVGQVSVRVSPNTSKFRRELYAYLKSLKNRSVVKVDVEPDLKKFRKTLREYLNGLTSDAVKVGVQLDKGNAKAELRALIGELKAQAATADVDVPIGVDHNGLRRGAAAITNMGAQASRMSGTFLGMGRVGWLIAAGMAAAAPATGLVVGLLAGLPSLMAGFGAAAGAVALGMEGIKAAAAPLKPQLDGLKAAVSQVFATRLPPIFEELSSKLLPTLTSGMTAVAGGLTDMFDGVAQALIGPTGEGITNLNTILQGTAGFLTQLSPIMGQFTDTFMTAAAAGANSFGHLRDMLGGFATEFGAVIDRMVSSGSFEGALAGMSQAVGGFLSLFSRLFEVGGTAMAQLGGPLNTLFGGLGDLLVAAMPALTTFSAGVADTIGALGTALAPAFAALQPALAAIMPAITQIATILGETLATAVVALAPVLTQLAQTLGPVLVSAVTALAPILTQVATTLGTVLLAAVEALAPVMPQITAAFVALASALGQGMATLLPVIADAFIQLLPVVIQLIPPLLQIVQAVIPLIPALAQVAAAAVGVVVALMPLINIFARLAAFTAEIIALFAGLAAAIVGKVAEMATGVISWFANMMETVTTAVAGGIDTVVQWFSGLPGKITGALGDLSGLLVSAGADLIRGLINGIKSMVGAAVQAAKNVASSVANAVKGFLGIGSPSKLFHEYGEWTATGLANGITAKEQDAADAATLMAQNVVDSANQVLKDGFTFEGITVDSTSTDDELKSLKDLLDLRTKELAVQKDGAPDKAAKDALNARVAEMNAMKRQISLQREQIEYQGKYGAGVADTASTYDSMLQSAAKAPYDFAMANADQFMSDLGIGGGALTGLAKAGMEYGTNFVFNVGNMDDALRVKSNEQNKMALAATGSG